MPEEQTMTRHEWERERAAELNSKTVADLAGKVAALEFDLKAVRTDRDALRTQLPPEGSVILKGAEKDRWEAYSALGKPEDLKAALADRDTLTADKAKRDRTDSIRNAAEASGYKASVLERLAPAGVTFTVRDETKDGQTVKVAYAKDGEGAETPLTDFVTKDFADFLPALTATATPASPPPPLTPRAPAQEAKGTPPTPNKATVQEIAAQKAADPSYQI